MERTACVDLQALPLQLLLRRHPDWAGGPAAVVDRDHPNGTLLWVNAAAQAGRVLTGMRYADALSLALGLHAGTVAEAEVSAAVEEITQRLWRFSPRIEPSAQEAGVFWLDASGLRYLFRSPKAWAGCIREDLAEAGFRAVVAVGFSKFGSYAAAKVAPEVIVFRDVAHEQAHAREIRIDALNVEFRLRNALLKLGVHTLGQFMDLPLAGVRKRFGEEAEALHRLAHGAGWAPLVPAKLREPVALASELEYPEENADRIVAVIAGLLHAGLDQLAEQHEALRALRVVFMLDDGGRVEKEIAPATPTRDADQVLQLLRLSLEGVSLTSGVVAVKIHLSGTELTQGQLELFADLPQQKLEAVYRAFDRLRAEYGAGAVVRARLQEGHLPEARYTLEAMDHIPPARPTEVALMPLVRRVFTPALALPPRNRHEPDGWLVAGIEEGPVDEVLGPHIVSGGWWARELSRAYYYVRTRRGRWLWIYRDERRRRWFLHGEVR